MYAVTVHNGGLLWAQRPEPQPTGDYLLVRVRAAGLNSADLLQRRGLYPAPAGSPADIPGLELAGEVVAAGDGVTLFHEGDRVMAVVGGGGQAELAVVHERTALRVPDSIPWAQAGGFPEVFTTAYDALFSQCQLSVGERLLVHGGAGGVGTAAIQLGVAVGAQVTATVRNEAQQAATAALGCTVCSPGDFAARGPFDVILELIGAPNIAPDLDALATGGRVAVIGVGAGAIAEINLLTLMARRARIHGSTLRARALEDKAGAARAVEARVIPLLAAGRVHVPVAQTFPMADAESAYEAFAAGNKFGKIVLLA